MSLFSKREYYKPFEYPWAYDYWMKQQQIHWLPEEVPLHDDVKDWNSKLSVEEKNLLTNIFRFFTQADIDVAAGYHAKYIPHLGGHPELKMMMSAFANMESVHIAAYSLLLETVGMPETEYRAFAEYKEMVAKHEYLHNFGGKSKEDVIKSIAVYSAFNEGLQLFSSFVILLNFTRFNKMKGMGQIIAWSVRDEALTPETLVLCEDGSWIRIDELAKDPSRKILQYDMNTENMSFVSPETIKKVTRNTTHEFSAPGLFYQHVSPNHRMIIKKPDGSIDECLAKDVHKHLDTDVSLVISGNKIGNIERLNDDHKRMVRESIENDNWVWLQTLLPQVSKNWCKEFTEYLEKYSQ